MRDTGVKPDVQRVSHLVILISIVAEQFGRIQVEPGIDTALFHALRNLLARQSTVDAMSELLTMFRRSANLEELARYIAA